MTPIPRDTIAWAQRQLGAVADGLIGLDTHSALIGWAYDYDRDLPDFWPDLAPERLMACFLQVTARAAGLDAGPVDGLYGPRTAAAVAGLLADGPKTVDQLAREIVEREGGYVNDPDDPGGPTKYGVTLATLQRLEMDLDGDGDVDRFDVMALDLEEAVGIFVDEYFVKPRIGLLPEALQAPVFDMHVNAGANAQRILQRLLRSMGEAVAVDGALGPQTAAAAERVAETLGAAELRDAYGAARRDYYYGLGDARAALRKYARRESDGGKGGWITRAEEFMRPAARLTDGQHRARVSAWA